MLEVDGSLGDGLEPAMVRPFCLLRTCRERDRLAKMLPPTATDSLRALVPQVLRCSG